MVGDQLSTMIAMEKEREEIIQIFEEVQSMALSKIETVPFNQIVEKEQIAILRLPTSNTSNQYRQEFQKHIVHFIRHESTRR